MVIPKYLNFYLIILIKNLQIHQKHYDKRFVVLGMVIIKFLAVKLQNFVKIAHYCALRQERVKLYAFILFFNLYAFI